MRNTVSPFLLFSRDPTVLAAVIHTQSQTYSHRHTVADTHTCTNGSLCSRSSPVVSPTSQTPGLPNSWLSQLSNFWQICMDWRAPSPRVILKDGVLQWQIAVVRHRTWWHLSTLLCSPFSHYLFSPIYTDACISPSLKYFIVSLLHSHNFLKYPIVGLLMPLRPMLILLPPPYQLKSFGGTCQRFVPAMSNQ